MDDYKIGDKVYFIKTFDEIYHENRWLKPPLKAVYPFEKKITQIVHSKNGTLYQVKGGHFHESWINVIVFNSKEKAEMAIKQKFKK